MNSSSVSNLLFSCCQSQSAGSTAPRINLIKIDLIFLAMVKGAGCNKTSWYHEEHCINSLCCHSFMMSPFDKIFIQLLPVMNTDTAWSGFYTRGVLKITLDCISGCPVIEFIQHEPKLYRFNKIEIFCDKQNKKL